MLSSGFSPRHVKEICRGACALSIPKSHQNKQHKRQSFWRQSIFQIKTYIYIYRNQTKCLVSHSRWTFNVWVENDKNTESLPNICISIAFGMQQLTHHTEFILVEQTSGSSVWSWWSSCVSLGSPNFFKTEISRFADDLMTTFPSDFRHLQHSAIRNHPENGEEAQSAWHQSFLEPTSWESVVKFVEYHMISR